MAGLDAPTSGSVSIDGVDITALDEDALAKLRGEKIGFVFQFFHLIPSLTALENVAVPMEIAGAADAAAARANALLEEVGLDRARASLPVAAVGRRAAARRPGARARQRSAASCWRTSRPAIWTRATAGTSWICCGRFTSARAPPSSS